MLLKPKNWEKFQHYKDRLPPWIKLHRELLTDRAFMQLPIASKALAPLLWLLASESKDGTFDASDEELMFRLHVTAKDLQGVQPLIDKGFFVVASPALADCTQVATPETETERETEKTLSGKPDLKSPALEVLNFLNEKTGRNYRPVDANLEKIKARLKDGATVDELRQVVAKKCREWGADEKMNQYLRPATLFNREKYAQYQGELLRVDQ